MNLSAPASTAGMALDKVLRGLQTNSAVEGVLIIGSAAKDTLHSGSDYDLAIVLSALPGPVNVVLTTIDHRLADIIFFSTAHLDRVTAADQHTIHAESKEALLVGYLQSGVIAVDRTMRLEAARKRARAADLVMPPSDLERYDVWQKIAYNVAQTRRYLRAESELYQHAVDLRLLYQLSDLMVGYFELRGLRWKGEKDAIHYWEANDPAYWGLFQRCLGESERAKRVRLYDELAGRTVAPFAELPSIDETTIALEAASGASLAAVESAHIVWRSLISTGP
jgi:predicted nucleotidyltransferase